MTQNQIRLAVESVNSTIAINNPKGVTDALRNIGYVTDTRYDVMSYSELTKALSDLFYEDANKWGKVVSSVEFNYEKTDDSTSPVTRQSFENIIRSFNPNDTSLNVVAKEKSKWWQTALNYILGSTTTVTYGPGGPSSPKVSPWVYVGLSVIGLIILILVIYSIRKLA